MITIEPATPRFEEALAGIIRKALPMRKALPVKAPEADLVRQVRYEVARAADRLQKHRGMTKDAAWLAAFEMVVFGGKDEFRRFSQE